MQDKHLKNLGFDRWFENKSEFYNAFGFEIARVISKTVAKSQILCVVSLMEVISKKDLVRSKGNGIAIP